MWNNKRIFFLALVFIVQAKAQVPNLDNVGDILQSLKDSGMMDKFEKDLKQMLFEQTENTIPDDAKDSKSSSEDSQVDSYEFIKAYVTEKNIKLNEKVMLYLMDLPIKDDLPKHLAKLTAVLDKIGDISKLENKEVNGKVIEAVKRIKTLTIMKTSLDKLYTDALAKGAASPEPKSKPESKPDAKPVRAETKPAKVEAKPVAPKTAAAKPKGEADDVTSAITTFLEMVKARPEQMISILSTGISAYELMSPTTLRSFEQYGKMFARTEYFVAFIDTLINWIEDVGQTEIGARLAELAPLLIQSGNMGDAMNLVSKELDQSKAGIIKLIQDPETKEKTIQFLATVATTSISWFQSLLNDDMKITFLNTFLLSQGFPSINSRKVIQSGSRLAEKVITTFTAWDVDVKEHEKTMAEFVRSFEETYVPWSDFVNLAEQEKTEIMQQFITENLVEPSGLIWVAHLQMVMNPKCAEAIVCRINSGVAGNKLKTSITRGLSVLATWAWSLEGKVDFQKAYPLIWAENCKNFDETCGAFLTHENGTAVHQEL